LLRHDPLHCHLRLAAGRKVLRKTPVPVHIGKWVYAHVYQNTDEP
jgi:hypothetical protein